MNESATIVAAQKEDVEFVYKLIFDRESKSNCKDRKINQIEVCTNKLRLNTQRFYKRHSFGKTYFKYQCKVVSETVVNM